MPSVDNFFRVLYTVERDIPEFSTISVIISPCSSVDFIEEYEYNSKHQIQAH